jgi:uncharacterized membrane protein YhaH (DUF805 family)
MGNFSIWHWLIVLVLVGVPLIFAFRSPPAGPNRFGAVGESMEFGAAITSFFGKYATFSGRASRSEFWYAAFWVGIISVVLQLLDPTDRLGGLWGLVTFLPSVAIACRRLHDTNRSGWLQLVSWFVPVGSIVMLIWMCKAPQDRVSGGSEA